MVAEQESQELAGLLLETSCQRQGIRRAQLTLHADRGAVMIASTLAQLLSDLGVTSSHSRPQVPDDNPFSEAHFKTMKYQPDFPERGGAGSSGLVEMLSRKSARPLVHRSRVVWQRTDCKRPSS